MEPGRRDVVLHLHRGGADGSVPPNRARRSGHRACRTLRRGNGPERTKRELRCASGRRRILDHQPGRGAVRQADRVDSRLARDCERDGDGEIRKTRPRIIFTGHGSARERTQPPYRSGNHPCPINPWRKFLFWESETMSVVHRHARVTLFMPLLAFGCSGAEREQSPIMHRTDGGKEGHHFGLHFTTIAREHRTKIRDYVRFTSTG